jgi:hypothetical protein
MRSAPGIYIETLMSFLKAIPLDGFKNQRALNGFVLVYSIKNTVQVKR